MRPYALAAMLLIALVWAPRADAAAIVHVPPGLKGPAPLVVLIHGCGTTPAEQQAASVYDPIADREGFVVLYPDDDDAAHTGGCWQWYDPGSWRRDSGDPAALAKVTRETMAAYPIDPERVYAIGFSSGGLITSDLVASYPDLYAAFGVVAGGPYRGVGCLGESVGNDPATLAQAAFEAEGTHARVLPFFVLYGDADRTIDPDCGRVAAEQWLRTDNLVAASRQDGPMTLARTESRTGGYPYDIARFTEPGGCEIGQRWTIHGMDHAWPGGPQDPRGPSAAEASWAFFSQHRLSRRCVTPAAAPAAAKPRPRKCRQRRYRRRHPRRCRR